MGREPDHNNIPRSFRKISILPLAEIYLALQSFFNRKLLNEIFTIYSFLIKNGHAVFPSRQISYELQHLNLNRIRLYI